MNFALPLRTGTVAAQPECDGSESLSMFELLRRGRETRSVRAQAPSTFSGNVATPV